MTASACLKANDEYPTRNGQCPGVASLRSADFINIELAEYLTWILDIPCWKLDILV
jgi:hypothetical protein